MTKEQANKWLNDEGCNTSINQKMISLYSDDEDIPNEVVKGLIEEAKRYKTPRSRFVMGSPKVIAEFEKIIKNT